MTEQITGLGQGIEESRPAFESQVANSVRNVPGILSRSLEAGPVPAATAQAAGRGAGPAAGKIEVNVTIEGPIFGISDLDLRIKEAVRRGIEETSSAAGLFNSAIARGAI